MTMQPDLDRLRLVEFVERFRGEVTPLSGHLAYFAAGLSMGEDELREYLEDPARALPASVIEKLPKIIVFLVPYLEHSETKTRRANGGSNGHTATEVYVTTKAPGEARQVMFATVPGDEEVAVAFAVKDLEMADYHYHLYRALASMLAQRLPPEEHEEYQRLLREELSANVHGEIDEQSWHAKQALVRRQVNLRRPSKGFADYARSSFVDTMTLYLHGLCCDIDLEPGPRQLASRYIRRRLQLLQSLFPPPSGCPLFPEEVTESPG